MKDFDEFIIENLVGHVKSEPKSKAARQAKRLGLKYFGFGRYGDHEGKVSYVVQDDKLVPFASGKDLNKKLSKSFEDKDANTKILAAQSISTVKKRRKADEEIIKQDQQKLEKVHRQLSNSSIPLDPEEENALAWYAMSGYLSINQYLYNGHAEGTRYSDSQDLEKSIQVLDNLFAKTGAPFDYTTYSGLSDRYNPKDFVVGSDYTFRGFISTSLDYKICITDFTDKPKKKKSGRVILQIEVRQGQPSIYLDPIVKDVTSKDEYESLLPRGSTIRIKSGPHKISSEVFMGVDGQSQDQTEDNTIVFHCELVEDEG